MKKPDEGILQAVAVLLLSALALAQGNLFYLLSNSSKIGVICSFTVLRFEKRPVLKLIDQHASSFRWAGNKDNSKYWKFARSDKINNTW